MLLDGYFVQAMITLDQMHENTQMASEGDGEVGDALEIPASMWLLPPSECDGTLLATR